VLPIYDIYLRGAFTNNEIIQLMELNPKQFHLKHKKRQLDKKASKSSWQAYHFYYISCVWNRLLWVNDR